jgi:hypothetical protein
MVLALGALAGLLVGLLLGGRPGRLADLPLRSLPLFGAAIGLQFLAYPPRSMPWHPGDRTATGMWLASYGIVIVVALRNLHIRGFKLATLGMLSNLIAVSANGGHMPALRSAMVDAGVHFGVRANSVAASSPNVPWLIDRWGAPAWVPMANVYSVGDLLLAAGAIVIVAAGMGARLPRLPRPRTA